MGFQQPPTLPDYSKLIQVLNSSGLQLVNPPTYEIISRLIEAVKQSQDVIVNNTKVFVRDALEGDGTKAHPLNVLVDGTTIDINASNQLETIGGGGTTLNSVLRALTETELLNMKTSPVTLLAAQGVGKRAIPIACLTHVDMTQNAAKNILFSLQYAAQILDITGTGTLFQSTGFGGSQYNSQVFPLDASFSNTIVPSNSAIIMKGNDDTTVGGGGPPISGSVQLFYILGSI